MAANARQLGAIGALGLAGFAAGQSVYRVPEGHAAVLYNQHEEAVVLGGPHGPGFHLRVPFRDVAAVYDMQPCETELEVTAQTKDGLDLDVTLACKARVRESSVASGELLGMTTDELVSKVMPVITTEAVRTAVGQNFVEQVLGNEPEQHKQRIGMFQAAEARLKSRAESFHLEVDDVHFPNIAIPMETQRRMTMKNEDELDAMLAQAAMAAKNTPTEAQKEEALEQQLLESAPLRQLREGDAGAGAGADDAATGSPAAKADASVESDQK